MGTDFTPRSQSCGYAIPFYTYEKDRMALQQHFEGLQAADDKDPNGASPRGWKQYLAFKNSHSIDGLPGLDSARALRGPMGVTDELKVGGVFKSQKSQRSWLSVDSGLPIALAFAAGAIVATIVRKHIVVHVLGM